MDNHLIDRETLGQFVDELIKKKPLPVNTAEELNQFREEQINALDDHINRSIFEQLDDKQLDEIDKLLDQSEATADDFKQFFNAANIDLEKTISNAVQTFGENFLAEGGNV